MKSSHLFYFVTIILFFTSCATTTDKQSILGTEADINYVESEAEAAAREAAEEKLLLRLKWMHKLLNKLS